jgi:hypothetical protein
MVAKTPSKQLGFPQLIQTMDCAISLAVGDFVYQSVTINNRAIKITDNNSPNPVLGRVRAKPTTTTCEVLLTGITDYTVGRGRVFIDATGGLTTTPPTTNYLQEIGTSFGNGKVLLLPRQRVKRA